METLYSTVKEILNFILHSTNLLPKEIIKDPSIAFGEAYMNGDIEIEGNLEKAIESIYKNKDSF